MRLLGGAVLLAFSSFASAAGAASSADELVEQARAHEAAHEDDLAIRRYMEALSVDPTTGAAWLGLGALRMRLGDAAEADRVYSAALQHVPALHRALEGRARALWAMGRRSEAEETLDAYATLEDDAPALRELAAWYGSEGRTPAQLATWRRLLARAVRSDASAESEARRMVRALVILVDGADPAASPPRPDATRRALAAVARRGG